MVFQRTITTAGANNECRMWLDDDDAVAAKSFIISVRWSVPEHIQNDRSSAQCRSVCANEPEKRREMLRRQVGLCLYYSAVLVSILRDPGPQTKYDFPVLTLFNCLIINVMSFTFTSTTQQSHPSLFRELCGCGNLLMLKNWRHSRSVDKGVKDNRKLRDSNPSIQISYFPFLISWINIHFARDVPNERSSSKLTGTTKKHIAKPQVWREN